jgi:hypothetical protein
MDIRETNSLPLRETSAFNLRNTLNVAALMAFGVGGYLEANEKAGSDILLLSGTVALLVTLVFMVQDMQASGETGPLSYLTAGTLFFWIIGATFKGFHWPFGNMLAGFSIIITLAALVMLIIKKEAVTMPRQLAITFFLFLLYLTGLLDVWKVFG